MATHSSIFAWRIPMDRESGGLQCMGLQRVGHERLSTVQYCNSKRLSNFPAVHTEKKLKFLEKQKL